MMEVSKDISSNLVDNSSEDVERSHAPATEVNVVPTEDTPKPAKNAGVKSSEVLEILVVGNIRTNSDLENPKTTNLSEPDFKNTKQENQHTQSVASSKGFFQKTSRPGTAAFSREASTVSSISSAKIPAKEAKLPHPPGHIPSYMKNNKAKASPSKSKISQSMLPLKTRPTSTAMSSVSEVLGSQDDPKRQNEKLKSLSTKEAQLPHVLGHVPNYLKKAKASFSKPQTAEGSKSTLSQSTFSLKARPMSTASSMASSVSEALSSQDNLKTQNDKLKVDLIMSQRQAKDLAKSVEVYRKKLDEIEKLRIEKEKKLSEESKKLSDRDQRLKIHHEKMKNTEKKLAELQKTNDDSSKIIAVRDSDNENLKSQINKLELEMKKKTKTWEALVAEKTALQQTLEVQVRNLENHLMTKESECTDLKKEYSSLQEKLRKIQSDFVQGDHAQDSDELNKFKSEMNNSKNNNQKMQQEINMLRSKLEDEQNKNSRIENLLQLRGEYIKTLQDTDEVNKSRITLHLNELYELREKVQIHKNFKAASREDHVNLHNQMKDQLFTIDKLKRELEINKEKLRTFEITSGSTIH